MKLLMQYLTIMVSLLCFCAFSGPATPDADVNRIRYANSEQWKYDKTLIMPRVFDKDFLILANDKNATPSPGLIERALQESRQGNNYYSFIAVGRLLPKYEKHHVILKDIVNTMIGNGSSMGLVFRGDLKASNRWGVDPCDAIMDYSEAHEMRLPIATTKLAMYTLAGTCVEENKREAIDLLLQAASENEPVAETILGEILIANGDAEHEIRQGIIFMERAIAHGSSTAKLDLAKHYIRSDMKDKQNTIMKLLIEATGDGVPDSAHMLSRYMYLSEGLDSDLKERAAKELKKYETSEKPDELYAVAVMYHHALGVDVDYNNAFAFYEKSYNAGNEMAGISLIKMFHEGLGIEKDDCKSKMIALELVSRGYEKAKKYASYYADLDCSAVPSNRPD